MSWSYSGDPSTSPKDEVRFLVGDTDSTKPLISDEEVNYTIALVYAADPPASGNYLPAAFCADSIASKSARSVDKSVGDLRISYSQQAKAFRDMAFQLRQRATLAGVKVYAGGQLLGEKLGDYVNTDLPQAEVKVDGMNYANRLNSDDESSVSTIP